MEEHEVSQMWKARPIRGICPVKLVEGTSNTVSEHVADAQPNWEQCVSTAVVDNHFDMGAASHQLDALLASINYEEWISIPIAHIM